MVPHFVPVGRPNLDWDGRLGLTIDAAEEAARARGVERIRILEVVDGVIRESNDLMLSPERLDLMHGQGRVVHAMFPTK